MIRSFSTWSFTAGLTLGILITGAYFLGNRASSLSIPASSLSPESSTTPLLPADETNTTSIPLTSSAQESGALSVVNQSAGDSVAVESVTVPPPGVWVAVREIGGDGTLGNVLGAARVAGPRTNVTVPLLRATEPDRTYAIELYRDDNNGTFDPEKNSVYVDFNTGARVVVYFKTTQ